LRGLFLAALRLKAGVGEVVDLRHSVEPQDLSDCRALVLFVSMDNAEEHGLAIGIFDFNRIPTSAGHVVKNDGSRTDVPTTLRIAWESGHEMATSDVLLQDWNVWDARAPNAPTYPNHTN
jgi:hypothetical protein